MFKRYIVAIALLALASAPLLAQESAPIFPYQRPPRAIQQVLDIAPTPAISVNPPGDTAIFSESSRYPSIADLAQPMLRLAGARINPATNGPHNPPRGTGFTLRHLTTGKETKVHVPADALLGGASWSPDGRRFAFTNTTRTGIELWVAETETGKAARVEGVALNATVGFAVMWLPDSKTLLCRTVPAGRGPAPVEPQAPAGPHVEESFGKAAPVPTFQDLLDSTFEEAQFDYYFTSQLALVDVTTGKAVNVGAPHIFLAAQPAPDGRHVLVGWAHRPYSYLVTAGSFPRETEVWDRTGKVVYRVASQPLAESTPMGGTITGPRSIEWLPVEPATLVWAEALDGGNPRNKVPHRDKVVMIRAPFTGEPAELLKTEHRFRDITFGQGAGLAMLTEFDRDTQMASVWFLNYYQPAETKRLGWKINARERYKDPGNPVMRRLRNGHTAMLMDGGEFIFLTGAGATPEGDRPFLDSFDTNTMSSERLFRSDAASYESFVSFARLAERRRPRDPWHFITRHETSTSPPNYFLRTVKTDTKQALTNFTDEAPQLRAIKKELVRYKRSDGVDLSFTLYLPPDYQPGERRPGVVWAYPLEFTDASVAGQVSASPNRYFLPAGSSHLFYLLAGYVVLDNATMPVIGDPETMNNTYVQQISASAKAAVDKAAEMGVLDPNRVGVAGHSYGAFMTANLLAHTDYFRAGVARSGAYNRTLTPFGFQSERRTLWEARDMYINISPFLHAHKIQEPILLIHGEADNNSGTFPIQSERMYRAVKGNGGNVRYVTLPHESHGYAARESVEHTLWEMLSWFDKHVKNAGQPTMKAEKE
jgi:dipeptidyl aminopeptidase/acylaminoacyl peptidase